MCFLRGNNLNYYLPSHLPVVSFSKIALHISPFPNYIYQPILSFYPSAAV